MTSSSTDRRPLGGQASPVGIGRHRLGIGITTREGFPHMALLAHIVLAIGLILH